MTNCAVFLELPYYSAPRIRGHFIHPVSRNLESRYRGSDTCSLLMSAISHRSKLHIIDYDAVLSAHPRFVGSAQESDEVPILSGFPKVARRAKNRSISVPVSAERLIWLVCRLRVG